MAQSLKPQDVVLAMRLALRPGLEESQRALAAALKMSASEVNHGLVRLEAAHLYNRAERRVIRSALREFLVHGLRYAFPAELGPMRLGLPTAHSAPPLVGKLLAEPTDRAVWPMRKQAAHALRGRCVVPLYAGAPEAAVGDPELHEWLALVDAVRVGRARERKMAADELTARLS